jgi:hypothetical protein
MRQEARQRFSALSGLIYYISGNAQVTSFSILPQCHIAVTLCGQSMQVYGIAYGLCPRDRRDCPPDGPSHVYGRHQARAGRSPGRALASPCNIPRSVSLDGASDARATLRPAHEQLSLPALVSVSRIRQVRLRSCVTLAAVKRVLANLCKNKKLLAIGQQD